MKLPYGLADFYKIRKEGYFYQDRTHFIRVVEERGTQLVFLRPRRFGKSLWLSMLANYYDILRAADFAMLFGNLVIGQNPTPLHNRHFILRWDFSKVAAFGTVEEVVQHLYNIINEEIKGFENRYRGWLPHPIEINPADAVASFNNLLSVVQQAAHPLYLLIDEYDNFANEIAMGGARSNAERYQKMVTGDGVLKTVFKNVKAAMGEGRLDRVFVTGVSPMLLSDLTSGFNTATDISLERQMHDLCGFTEAEVVALTQQISDQCGFTTAQTEQTVQLMRSFYNGYTFLPEATAALYNPTLSLYFLDALQRDCAPPAEMLDVNLSMDKNKLEYIAGRPGGAGLIQKLLEEQPSVGVQRIVNRFSLQDLLKPKLSITSLASLLFYFGMTTVQGRNEQGQLQLRIPNLVTHGLYFEQLRELLLPDEFDQDEGHEVVRYFD